MGKIFTDNIVDINTLGGYTYEQIMNNKNCSKDPKYWYLIKSTVNEEDSRNIRYLFKSKIAESWEFLDTEIDNPIRNTNQIYIRFLDVSKFVEPSNYFRENKIYTNATPDTLKWNRFWDDLEEKVEDGFMIEGVRITGRFFFLINFGRFRAIPVDEEGRATSTRKIWTFLRFIDHQYYMMNELEECLLEGPYRLWEDYTEWFPAKTREDFELQKLESFVLAKGRRKGWTANIAIGVFNYNFTFLESSMSILAAYEKSHYGPMLSAIHNTKTFLDKNTPWKRRTDIKGTHDHFIAGIETTDEYGMKLKEGYLSEIQATSFKDNPFKGIGATADIINIEEAGKFDRLLETYPISIEPLIRDGETMIGIAIAGGCVCKGTKVYKANGEPCNIEDITLETGILSYDGENPIAENVSWLKPVTKKDCYRIITSNGKHIDCSYDHPLLWSKNHKVSKVEDKYVKQVTIKRAAEIGVGDQLMCISNLPMFGNKQMWIPRLVGLMIGDGHYGGFGGDQLYVGDEEIFEWVKDQGIIYNIIKKFNTKKGGIYRSLGLSKVRDELRKLGIYGQTGHRKTLPLNMYEYDKYSISELLGGYFDADGDVTYNKKKDNVRIRLTCAYKSIVEEVQLLLYKFNIDCYIEKCKRVKGYGGDYYYNLVIYRRKDVLNFKDNITFLCKHKQDKLNKVHDNKATRYCYPTTKFVINPENGKGEYFIKNGLKELRSVVVKEVIFLGEQDVYNLTADTTHSYITNGFLSMNTAGDMESGGSIGLAEIMSNPKQFGFKPYANIYEENDVPEDSGYFIDDLWYSPVRVRKEEILKLDDSERTKNLLCHWQGEVIEAVDEQGNSYRYLSELILNAKRDKRRKSNIVTYQKFITQQPKYLSEAFLLNESSPFDVATAKEVLGQLSVEKVGKKKGVFSILNGNPSFKHDINAVEIDEYPFKGKDTTGCWVIYEDPIRTNEEILPWRYIGGNDPIDFGSEETSSSGGHSFAATYILDTITRNIVAEYIGRPRKAEDYFEQLWRGLEYYNAFLLYENNLKSLFSYFKLKNKLYLLAGEPESLKSRVGYKANNRIKGFHATAATNSYGRDLINTWSLELIPMNQDDEGKVSYIPRMYFIKSKGLLQEMIRWNSKGNFDRISSFGATMIMLFDRNYDEDDVITTKQVTDKGIFKKVKDKINRRKQFNFK